MVTYLFGAGASANAVPVVKEFKSSFGYFMHELKKSLIADNPPNSKFINHDGYTFPRKKYTQRLLEICGRVMLQASFHQTIDTYAKRLYLLNMELDYEELKIAMTAFFIFIQSIKPFDNRYDHFIASIIDKVDLNNNDTPLIPENIKLLSWNYDIQFEIAISRYLPGFIEFPEINDKAGIVSLNALTDDRISNSCYIKLNGSASLVNKDNGSAFYPERIPYRTKVNEALDRALIASSMLGSTYKEKNTSNLRFSWETYDNPKSSEILQTIASIVKETDVLVVIGYTFPFFNRRIDRLVINAMRKLEKVYIQAPEGSVYDIISAFDSIGKLDWTGSGLIKPIPVKYIDQFFLAPDL